VKCYRYGLLKFFASRIELCLQVKLIVVDSIAFHFRQDFDDYLLRSRLLNTLAQTFNMLAAKHNVAVRSAEQ